MSIHWRDTAAIIRRLTRAVAALLGGEQGLNSPHSNLK